MASSQTTSYGFIARALLRGGHRQTLASFFLPRHVALPPSEERMVEVEPGVKVRCICHWQANRSQALTVIIIHGLEGSSDSQYMRGIAAKGYAAGMNVIRMNQRNCGGTDHASPTLYHSGRSADIAAVAEHLLAQDRILRFALVGYSMGGNLVLKLAGEWGQSGPSQFCAVAAVCPALDLAASADALHEPTNRIYEYYFIWQLNRRFHAKAKLFPGKFDVNRLRGIRSLRDFDDKITAYYSGFTGAADYYARAAAANVVDKISLPALILHAANDPFIRITAPTRAKILANPHINFVETRDGGHCSFLAAQNGSNRDGYWAEWQVVDFLQQIGRAPIQFHSQ